MIVTKKPSESVRNLFDRKTYSKPGDSQGGKDGADGRKSQQDGEGVHFEDEEDLDQEGGHAKKRSTHLTYEDDNV